MHINCKFYRKNYNGLLVVLLVNVSETFPLSSIPRFSMFILNKLTKTKILK